MLVGLQVGTAKCETHLESCTASNWVVNWSWNAWAVAPPLIQKCPIKINLLVQMLSHSFHCLFGSYHYIAPLELWRNIFNNRVVQSCHLLVCLFIYRHFTVKLAISEYDRCHLFVIYYAYLILTYCWFDSNVDKQKNKWQLWTTLIS